MSVESIKAAVCEAFGVLAVDMTSHRRARSVARPRQVAMYLARQLTPLSLPSIGRLFGNRDHTTVMHAIATVERLLKTDVQFEQRIAALMGKCAE